MKGFVPSETGHVVQLIAPANISGGALGQPFNMTRYQHACILVLIGVANAAFIKIIVNQCTDAAGDGAVAIPFNIYKQEAAGTANDVISARTPVSAAGYSPSSASGIFYVIELDANELADGFPYVQLQLENDANDVIASAVAILSGSRLAESQSPTVTS